MNKQLKQLIITLLLAPFFMAGIAQAERTAGSFFLLLDPNILVPTDSSYVIGNSSNKIANGYFANLTVDTCTGCGGGATATGTPWQMIPAGVRLTTTTNQVLIGGSATATLAKLEVQGLFYVSGNATTTGIASSTLLFVSSTSTQNGVSASYLTLNGGNLTGGNATFVGVTTTGTMVSQSGTSSAVGLTVSGFASTTQLSVARGFFQGEFGDCDTGATSKTLYDITTGKFSCGTDQSGAGGGTYPFFNLTNYGTTTQATTSPLTASLLFASSTSGTSTFAANVNILQNLQIGAGTASWYAGVDANDSNAYKIATNSAFRPSPFIITTAGNVGIGSTTPTQALTVSGGIQVNTNVDVIGLNIVASSTEYLINAESSTGDAVVNVKSTAGYGAASIVLDGTANEYSNVKGYINGSLEYQFGRVGDSEGFAIYVLDGLTKAIHFYDDKSTEFFGAVRLGVSGLCSLALTSDAPSATAVSTCNTLSVTSNDTTSTNRTFCLLAGSEGQILKIFADVTSTNEIELGDGGAGACAGATGAATFLEGVWPANASQNNDVGTFIYRTTASGAVANGWYEVSRAAN